MRIFLILSLMVTTLNAKPLTVKGAACKSCHTLLPARKQNLNPKNIEMLKKYKEADCKSCHGYADGKLTTKK